MAGDEDQPLNSPDATAALDDDRQQDMEDQAARLPGDVLADILHCVPPRGLAAARCVCKAWRDAVDGRRLLRADLLPLSLAGLFVHFNEHKYPEFLARPSSEAGAVSGDLSFLPSASPNCGYIWQYGCVDKKNYKIMDHCNGLLLLRGNYVVNPATRRWNTLPKCPAKCDAWTATYHERLVYDPMVSPYYEVFKIPTFDLMKRSEYPPSIFKMYVFSSKSGCWEERYFEREGDGEGIVNEMRAGYARFSSIYFREALYARCRSNFLIKISLANSTYSIIETPPMDRKVEGYLKIKLARSKGGVYLVLPPFQNTCLSFVQIRMYLYTKTCLGTSEFGQIEDKYFRTEGVALDRCSALKQCWLRVWILNESCALIEWVLKHDKDLKHILPRQWFSRGVKWILEDINYNLFRASSSPKVNNKVTTEEKFEWCSDEDVEDEDIVDHGGYFEDMKAAVERKSVWNSNSDNALNNEGMVEDHYRDKQHYDDLCDEGIKILGFHPYKEIVFLGASQRRCLAYHLNGFKIEELGNIYPKEYIYFKELSNEHSKIKSFIYTPCWIDEFPENN